MYIILLLDVRSNERSKCNGNLSYSDRAIKSIATHMF